MLTCRISICDETEVAYPPWRRCISGIHHNDIDRIRKLSGFLARQSSKILPVKDSGRSAEQELANMCSAESSMIILQAPDGLSQHIYIRSPSRGHLLVLACCDLFAVRASRQRFNVQPSAPFLNRLSAGPPDAISQNNSGRREPSRRVQLPINELMHLGQRSVACGSRELKARKKKSTIRRSSGDALVLLWLHAARDVCCHLPPSIIFWKVLLTTRPEDSMAQASQWPG